MSLRLEGSASKSARARAFRASCFYCLLLFAFCLSAYAKNGAFRSSKHGDRVKGPQRRADRPTGSCGQCHDEHASHTRGATRNNNAALFTANDNDFCFTCHAGRSEAGAYPGNAIWWPSIHATSPAVYRAGKDPRPPSDANLCVNCHDPHGVIDSEGLIPSMLVDREPHLCMLCHDGSRARDLTNEIAKPFRHPFGMPLRPGGNDRHVQCSDCHNSHAVKSDRRPPLAPAASSAMRNVGYVEVVNGPPGGAPRYVWHNGAEASDANEYEVCFKCHSSFTHQPPGQSDLALLTNPSNPSYHPVQAAGRNRIDSAAFVPGFSSDSLVRCSDCHGSDDPGELGVHASQYRYILKRPSTVSSLNQRMRPDDICFSCHAYAVYANQNTPAMTLRASRFNLSGDGGHAFHVGGKQIACYACHETHGSTRYPALIARRVPGITNYTQSATGGTCNSSCHLPKTYKLAYPR